MGIWLSVETEARMILSRGYLYGVLAKRQEMICRGGDHRFKKVAR